MTSKFCGLSGVAICLALAGCAAQPERLKLTASNYPEGTFKSAELDVIRAKILDACTQHGYIVSEASTNMVVCQKDTKGMEEVVARLAVGNSYSTTPFQKVRATLYKIDNDVKVTLSNSLETQMPFGQVRSIPLNSNATFNEMQKMLNDAGAV